MLASTVRATIHRSLYLDAVAKDSAATISMSKSAARCCPLFGTQEVKAILSHTGGPVFSMIMDSSWGTNGVPSLWSYIVLLLILTSFICRFLGRVMSSQ